MANKNKTQPSLPVGKSVHADAIITTCDTMGKEMVPALSPTPRYFTDWITWTVCNLRMSRILREFFYLPEQQHRTIKQLTLQKDRQQMGIVIRQSLKGTVLTYIGAAIGFVTQFFATIKFLEPEVPGLTKVFYEADAFIAGFALLENWRPMMGSDCQIREIY